MNMTVQTHREYQQIDLFTTLKSLASSKRSIEQFTSIEPWQLSALELLLVCYFHILYTTLHCICWMLIVYTDLAPSSLAPQHHCIYRMLIMACVHRLSLTPLIPQHLSF